MDKHLSLTLSYSCTVVHSIDTNMGLYGDNLKTYQFVHMLKHFGSHFQTKRNTTTHHQPKQCLVLMLTTQVPFFIHCPFQMFCIHVYSKQHQNPKLKSTSSEASICVLHQFQHGQLILDIIDLFSMKSINFYPEATQNRSTKHKCYFQLLLPI